MSAIKECKWCHLKNSFSVTDVATCSLCGFTATLCENCWHSWKNQKCPGCGAGPANAKWQHSSSKSGGSSDSGSSSHVHVVGPSDIWFKHKEAREKQRADDGSESQYGQKISAGEVQGLRELEEAMITPLKVGETGAFKDYTFVVRDGKVVELYISHENSANHNDWSPALGKLVNLEGLKISKSASKDTYICLKEMKNLKKLSFHSANDITEQIAMQIGALTQLEELNILGLIIPVPVLDKMIGTLVNLKKLNLAWIKNKDLPPSLKNCQKLEEISLINGDVHNLPGWIAQFPKLRLLHQDKDQFPLGLGATRDTLQKNNPACYPKLSMKDKLMKGVTGVLTDAQLSPDQIRQKWLESLPEELKKGWSGIP
jgi:hypothetical protein